MTEIDRLQASYNVYSQAILERLGAIIATENRYLNLTELQSNVGRRTACTEINKQKIENKRRQASGVMRLESTSQVCRVISEIIARANIEVEAHNVTVDNIIHERNLLTSHVWKYVLEERSPTLSTYGSEAAALKQVVSGLEAAIVQKTQKLRLLEGDLSALEKSVTSVQPTVTAINQTLSSCGFNGFKLATTGGKSNLYEIVRMDGIEVGRTLSEGERSFVTFLYFYHLIRGSTLESGATVERVVVFDDPKVGHYDMMMR